ncbi:Caleosin-related [Parasponia andersonii]|uniref:Caleosin-related n=1 Tax=Parasponia andersonii TaxID=3476 RepID=A0A2P5DAK4_PARAD|nr:Caleosin-related [Parasponia andersonii]
MDEEEGGKFVPSDEFVLQKHVAFFDRNHDGIIYPWETYQGFRAIGSGIAFSALSAFLINISLSGKTRPNGNVPEYHIHIQNTPNSLASDNSDNSLPYGHV